MAPSSNTVQLQHPRAEKTEMVHQHPAVRPLAIVSNMFFPLVASSPPWLIIEIALLSPLGAIYSSFVYEKAVLHMGDYRTRMRRFSNRPKRERKADSSTGRERRLLLFHLWIAG